MYAVIRTGGKQYRVTVGDILEVEKLEGEVGDTIAFEDVLLVSDDESATIGQPLVDGAAVNAKITGQYRGKKILVFRYRPKKRIRVRRGHRQYLTRLEIESVAFGGVTYDTAPEKPAGPEKKPKRQKKKKKIPTAVAAAAAPAAAPMVEEAFDDTAVEEAVVEESAVEEVVVEEVAAEEVVETAEEVVEDVATEEPVAEVEAAVEPVVEEAAPAAKADDLTKVNGIGKVFSGRLIEEFGITSFAELAAADAEKLAETCERSVEEVKDWIAQAKELAG